MDDDAIVVKRGRGRPRKNAEPAVKRPVGRPRKWTDDERPTYKPKGPEYFKKYYINIIKPKLEKEKLEQMKQDNMVSIFAAIINAVCKYMYIVTSRI